MEATLMFLTLKFKNWLISAMINDIAIWFTLNFFLSDYTQIIVLQLRKKFESKENVAFWICQFSDIKCD